VAEEPAVVLEVDDPLAVIRLNRPERLNALTFPMLGELRRAVSDAADDPSVVGIVITGAGRGFCSGLDADALRATTERGPSARPAVDARRGDVPGMFTWLLAVPKPVIAAVNGVAAGGGLVLATMCDLRFASTEGSFVTVFGKRGLVSEHGTTWILPRLVGAGRALDLLWSSRRVDAAEALRIGLVEYVAEPDQLLPMVRSYVAGLAAEVSPASMADTKRLVYAHLGTNYPEALAEIDEVQWAALARADAREGAMALIERRPPSFPRLPSLRALPNG
jgi:enoyl-CoA hydratase/carnithine racemase